MFRSRFFTPGVILLAFVLIAFPVRGISRSALALDINVIDMTGGTQAAALAAFEQAAGLWESRFTDDITINLEFNFAALQPGVLGGATSNTIGASFSDVKSALAGDITSSLDTTAVANLPGGDFMQFNTNNGAGDTILDNNNTANNYWMDVNVANARALGLYSASDSTVDGSIEFSTSYSFDFDPSDGIDLGTFDFVGISAHEIGHTLGFVSGVDTVDYFTGSGPYAPINLNPYRVFTPWDLYRYSEAGTLDFSTGGNSYFSVDGGATALASFSTGTYNGDGRQASHWKDSLGIGLMDPTFSYGELGVISSLDIDAFDAMGYDVAVPEPVSSSLFLAGGALLGFRRFRKS